MSRKMIVLTLLLLLFGLLVGCAAQATPSRKTGDALITEAAQTVGAMFTTTATYLAALPPTWTPTPTPTEPPTGTPTPVLSRTVTSTPALAATMVTQTKIIPCDLAQFLTDVTIPDGTHMLGGTTFIKTWQLRNAGSCTWDSSYELIFFGGSQLGGPATGKLTTGQILPGQMMQISVQLKAPTESGMYTGWWMLRNGNGAAFGIDTKGSAFYVRIVVDNKNATPTRTPTPTATP